MASPSIDELRERHYNAEISYVREHNDELRVIRVKPDHPASGYSAGQYTTLALGYWEPRADEAVEDLSDRQEVRLVRRAYSVSSSIVDEEGHPTRAALDRVLSFFAETLRAD